MQGPGKKEKKRKKAAAEGEEVGKAAFDLNVTKAVQTFCRSLSNLVFCASQYL